MPLDVDGASRSSTLACLPTARGTVAPTRGQVPGGVLVGTSTLNLLVEILDPLVYAALAWLWGCQVIDRRGWRWARRGARRRRWRVLRPEKQPALVPVVLEGSGKRRLWEVSGKPNKLLGGSEA